MRTTATKLRKMRQKNKNKAKKNILASYQTHTQCDSMTIQIDTHPYRNKERKSMIYDRAVRQLPGQLEICVSLLSFIFLCILFLMVRIQVKEDGHYESFSFIYHALIICRVLLWNLVSLHGSSSNWHILKTLHLQLLKTNEGNESIQ